MLIGYWTGGDFPLAAALSIFLVVSLAIFVLPNKVFAWSEHISSMVKIGLFLVINFLSLAVVFGAGSKGYFHGGNFWRDLPVFKNGFSGFAGCLLLATWAVGDQVFVGIMGGEAERTRFSMAHATKLVPFRVNVVYMLSVVLFTLLVPSNDKRLPGGGGVAASPFVMAVQVSSIPAIGSILNAGMIVGILGIAAESIYLSSRIPRSMSHQKIVPEQFAKVDNKGPPVNSLILICLVAIILTYLNLSAGGIIALKWLLNITSSCFFVNWLIIDFTSYRFRAALKAQNDPLFSKNYAWTSDIWPRAPAWLSTISLFTLAACIAAAVKPIGSAKSSAEICDHCCEHYRVHAYHEDQVGRCSHSGLGNRQTNTECG